MGNLLEVKAVDREFYEKRIRGFLPERVIDIHTHVWLEEFKAKIPAGPVREATWPSLVARDNSIEDLMETYSTLFPGKQVTPLIFSNLGPGDDFDRANAYVQACSLRYGFPSLLFARPEWPAALLEEKILKGGFLGCKVYLSLSEQYIPEREIRIYDFLPPHHLEVLDRHGWIIMLHIPRDGRLKDPVNLAQMLEIEQRYPNARVIIAHVGRAYCPEDVGNAFEALAETKNLLFDFSANTNESVFTQLIRAVGPRRILFGSDLPILCMRARRVCEGGSYVNLVPQALYGDLSGESHMRELRGIEADALTWLMYEEIDAFRRAAEAAELDREDVENIFFGNAARLLGSATRGNG